MPRYYDNFYTLYMPNIISSITTLFKKIFQSPLSKKLIKKHLELRISGIENPFGTRPLP